MCVFFVLKSYSFLKIFLILFLFEIHCNPRFILGIFTEIVDKYLFVFVYDVSIDRNVIFRRVFEYFILLLREVY